MRVHSTHLNRRGSKRDHLNAFNSVQFTMYYTFFFNVDAVVCQNNGDNIMLIIMKVSYMKSNNILETPS
jgi:hypothetical protein